MLVFLSIGILIKGPVSILIFFLTIFSFSCVERNFSIFLKIKPHIGLLIVCLIILPWVMAIQSSTDGVFFQKAIMEDFFAKLI